MIKERQFTTKSEAEIEIREEDFDLYRLSIKNPDIFTKEKFLYKYQIKEIAEFLRLESHTSGQISIPQNCHPYIEFNDTIMLVDKIVRSDPHDMCPYYLIQIALKGGNQITSEIILKDKNLRLFNRFVLQFIEE